MNSKYILRLSMVPVLALVAAVAFAGGMPMLGTGAALATLPALVYGTPPALLSPIGPLAWLGKLGETILDANETAFFTRQLEYIKARTYDVVYPENKATTLLPVDTEAGAGAQTITYRQYDAVGMAKIVSNYADDLPTADVAGKEFTQPIRSIGTSYRYNIQEIRAASMAGVSLEQRKANAARRANDDKVEAIAWAGDEEFGLLGLLNHPNVTRASAPADGTGGSRTFASKTPDMIIRDLNNMVINTVSLTKGSEQPDTLILPIAVHGYLSSTRMGDGSDTTILEFFLANNPSIKRVEWLNQAATAGVTLAGTGVAVAYKKDPDKLALVIPQPFEQFPEQAEGLSFMVPCHSRCGGVIVYYPLSVYILEGIS